MKIEQWQRAMERTRFFDVPDGYSVHLPNDSPTTLTIELRHGDDVIGRYDLYEHRNVLRYWIERDAWRHLAVLTASVSEKNT